MAPDDSPPDDATPDGPVPYQALYRRFRPQRFSDVLGQEHVTRPLKAAVRDGRVAHAYLFSGPRGTGKTTTARILAMALNCENPSDGEPCGECDSCLAIRAGASLDVQELDSATNRGIDEMRDLLSRVSLGTPGRWKVYIVDEVHQITAAAASALLKTLEEPPAHVIFVLATTDPQKVLDTIRSRTQHFEFRLLGSEVLISLLSDVARRADIDLSSEAIDVVVQRGRGSARDALSALDQVSAVGDALDRSVSLSDLVEAMIDRDAGAVLVKVAEAFEAGFDARRLGTELVEYLRNGFLAARAPSLVLLSESAVAQVADQAKRMGAAALVRAMELIGQALIDMRDSADPRITFEVALVRLSAPEVDHSLAALLERIERLEKQERSGAVASAVPVPSPEAPVRPVPSPPSRPAPSPPSRPVPGPPPPPDRAASTSALPPPPPGPQAASSQPPGAGRANAQATRPASPNGPAPPNGLAPPNGPVSRPETGTAPPPREELTLAWGDKVLPSLRPAVKVYVANGRFLPSDGALAVYAVPDQGLLARAEANRAEVETALSDHFGRPIRLRLIVDANAGSVSPPPADAASHPDEQADEEQMQDWSNMEEAPAAAMSPEQRLLEAFPGAEEVIP